MRNDTVSIVFHLRRRTGRTIKNNITAIAVPSSGTKNLFRGTAWAVELVVFTVNVAVSAPVPVNVTEDGILQVGISVGLAMAVVTTQAMATVPLNPFDEVTVIVAELPVVTPGRMVMAPLLLIAKLELTLIDAVPELAP